MINLHLPNCTANQLDIRSTLRIVSPTTTSVISNRRCSFRPLSTANTLPLVALWSNVLVALFVQVRTCKGEAKTAATRIQ